MAKSVRIIVSDTVFFQVNVGEGFNYAQFIQSIKDQGGFFDGQCVWVPLHSISHLLYLDPEIMNAGIESMGAVKS